jgi:hypothetical protein
VISTEGDIVTGETRIAAAQAAAESLPPGSFLFRIGERAVSVLR